MSDFKTLYVQISSPADIVVRNAEGRKLFDMNLHGFSITVVMPTDAAIQLNPAQDDQSAEKGSSDVQLH